MGLLKRLIGRNNISEQPEIAKYEQEQENKRKELQATFSTTKRKVGIGNLTEEEQKEFLELEMVIDSNQSLSSEEVEKLEILKMKFLGYNLDDENYKKTQLSLVKDFLQKEKDLLGNKMSDEEREEYQQLANMKKEGKILSDE